MVIVGGGVPFETPAGDAAGSYSPDADRGTRGDVVDTDGGPDTSGNYTCTDTPPLLVISTPYESPNTMSGAMIAFRADESESFNGGFTVQWSVEAPAGSGAAFIPSANSLNPKLPLDVPGDYTVSVEIEDGCGLRSNLVWPTYHASPLHEMHASGLHLAVGWAGDAGYSGNNYIPAGVANIDLHFTHPDAPFLPENAVDGDGDGQPDPYFEEGDCYPGNMTPDWGLPNLKEDDPWHLGDQQDAYNPEGLTLPSPEAGQYRVALYFNAHLPEVPAPGAATAVVIVYYDGEWVATETRELAENDLWCAGLVDGQTGGWSPCPDLPDGPVTHGFTPPLEDAP